MYPYLTPNIRQHIVSASFNGQLTIEIHGFILVKDITQGV